MKYDAIIIGAGPSGVIAAYTIAKENKKVAIIDEKNIIEIGDKICGDALRKSHTDFIYQKTGLLPPNNEEISDEIDYFVIKTVNNEMEFLAPGEGIVIDRKKYGQRLLAEVQKIGVSILSETTLNDLLIENDTLVGLEIFNKHTQNKDKIYSDISIDCSGRNHILRKKMPNNTFLNLEKNHKREEFSVAYREIIKLKKKKNPYKKKLVLIYDNIAPEPGYFWIFSKGEYELNVGIGWEQTKGNELKISIKSVFKEILMKFFSPSEYDVLQAGGYTIPTRYPLLNAVGNGFMTAGDAAFHTDPFLAEGHGPALLAGYYAGFYAVQSLNKGDYTEKGLWDYNIEILKSFGHTHLKSHLFVHMLTKVGMQEFFDFMLGKKIISFEEFRKVRKGEKISKKALLIKIFKISSRISYILNIITFQKQLKKLNSFIIDYPNSPELYESWKKNFDTWLTKQLQIKGK